MIVGTVNGQTLALTDNTIVGGTVDYLTAKIRFMSADWVGVTPYLCFRNGDTYFTIPIVNGVASRKSHINLTAGHWSVWVIGVAYVDTVLDERITTNAVEVCVKKTGEETDVMLPTAPADVIEELKEDQREALREALQEAKDSGEFKGDRGPIGPTGQRGPVGPQGETGETGATGSSGVYIGDTEPTDPGINVWIDESGESVTVPTELAELESDPDNRTVTDADIAEWNMARNKVDYLFPYINGQDWAFETAVTAAGSAVAPVGAKMASVNAIGMQAVRYNQLMPLTNKTGNTGLIYGWNASEQRFRVTGTPSAAYSTFALFQPTAGSKYYVYMDCENTSVKLKFANAQPNTYFSSSGIFSCTSSTGNRFGIVEGLVPGQTYDFGLSMFVVDLTAMFGAGNEPTTKSDPRIAWLDGYLTRNVAYNAGTLLTADAESVTYGETEQTIPAAIRAMPGYGLGLKDAPNELVRTEDGWKYVQRVEAGAAEGDLPTRLAEPVETDVTTLMGTALDPQIVAAGDKITIGDEDMLTSNTVEYMVKIEEVLA